MASKVIINKETSEKLVSMLSNPNLKDSEGCGALVRELNSAIMRSPDTDEALAANLLLDTLNRFGVKHNAFADAVLRSHKTIQQSFMRLMMNTIKALAEQKYYDDRNEATVLLAREIVPLADEHPLPFI